MKGRFIIIFTFLSLYQTSFSQIDDQKTINDIIDSISDNQSENLSFKEDTEKIAYIYNLKTENIPNLLNRADILIGERNLDEAIELLELIKDFSIEEKLPQTHISSLLKMGNIRFFQKNSLDAIKLYEDTISIINKSIENQDNENNIVNAEITDKFPYIYTRLSYFYFNENLQMSKSYMELAISLNEELGNIDSLAENYYNYVIILNKLNLQNKAMEQQKKYDLIFAKIKNHNFYKLPIMDADNGYEYNLNNAKDKNYSIAEYANIQILNKIDGFNYKFRTKIGGKLKYRNLEIITRNCLKSSAESSPENMLLLEVNEISSKKNIFNGWMFSSSPSINSLDHSIYDLRVVNCSLTPI